jgi:hypothetical protein
MTGMKVNGAMRALPIRPTVIPIVGNIRSYERPFSSLHLRRGLCHKGRSLFDYPDFNVQNLDFSAI